MAQSSQSGDRLLPFPLVYHDGYDLNFGDHVFPSQKYRLIRDQLIRSGSANPADFIAPSPASDEDLCLVHSPDWVSRLALGKLSPSEIRALEVPLSAEMVRAFWLATGGTILASRMAVEFGYSCNLSGGFHHAFTGHGEGFCAIHDVAVAIRKLQSERIIEKAFVLDCDVHHGNGTAAIFAGDSSVFTYSIHQFRNYPAVKPPSDLDVNLENGVGNEEYLTRLKETFIPALERFRPDLVCYVAGADPYYDDQLGGLALTIDGLRERDHLAISATRDRRIPIVGTFAGGYARKIADTVTIHANQILAAASIYRAQRP